MANEHDDTLYAFGVERGRVAAPVELTDDERKARLAAQEKAMRTACAEHYRGFIVTRGMASFLEGPPSASAPGGNVYDPDISTLIAKRRHAIAPATSAPAIVSVELMEDEHKEGARRILEDHFLVLRTRDERRAGSGALRTIVEVGVPYWPHEGRCARFNCVWTGQGFDTFLEPVDRHLEPPALVGTSKEPR